MRDLFQQDSERFNKYSLRFKDILLDYSKNRISENTMPLLIALAQESELGVAIDNMFSGKKVNFTENRAALHIALRNRSNRPIHIDGDNVMPKVNTELQKMRDFTDRVRSGQWKGYNGKIITDIVNIGIGGSEIGPKTVCEALKPYASDTLNVHFVSNIDGAHIKETLSELLPETTLFIITSKSFTSQETLINAKTARDWFLQEGGAQTDITKHFVAVSSNASQVQNFGIDTEYMFELWDWVGGRYSLWSTVGLSIALYIGMDNFEDLLAGAHDMDEHFKITPFDQNMPVILALLGIWYNNFFNAHSHAILPYDQHLHVLPAYIRQADMESNGKRINREGEIVDYSTGPIILGESGTNGQHTFYQLLHQGSELVPADFLAAAEANNPVGQHHPLLLSNFFAQTEALMCGKNAAEVRADLKQEQLENNVLEKILPHKIFPGNKPTNSILYQKLSPSTLGALIAMYEHKTYVQSVIWKNNAFDQWGVELGKQLAKNIFPELTDYEEIGSHDSSTNGLINDYKSRLKK